MLCDLTDAEGGTLHCGGPNDFGGTIAGTAKGMSGDDPAWFNFTVPYSASYTFETEATDVRIKATNEGKGGKRRKKDPQNLLGMKRRKITRYDERRMKCKD